MAKKQKVKGGRKFGRTARKPATANRKLLRPDLKRKFKNVLQSSGHAAAKAWIKAKLKAGETSVLKFERYVM